MKTILIAFFLSGLGLWAQTSATLPDDADVAAQDALLRKALRSAIVADAPTNNATPAPAPVQVPTNAAPVHAATNLPAPAPAAIPVPAPAPVSPLVTTNALPPATAPRAFPSFPAFPAAPTADITSNAPPGSRPNRLRNRNNTPNPVTPGVLATPGSPPAFPAFPAAPGMAASGATNNPAAKSESTIPAGEINFPSVNLDQVLQVYAELVGRTVLHAQLPQVQISLKTETQLTKSEAVQAFDTVLAMNNITMINVGDKFVKAVPVNLAYQQASPFTTTEEGQLPEADQYVTHIAQLKYAKPSEMVPVLTPLAQIPNSILPIDSSQILIIRDYAANVKRMLELIKKVDIVVPSEFESEVIPIKYAQATDIQSALSSLSSGGSGGGTTIGKSSASGGTGSNRSTLGGANSTGSFNNGFQNTAGGLNNNTGGLGGGNTGGSRTSSFGDRLKQIVDRASNQGDFTIMGQTKIIADQRTNSLLVFASKQDMAMIKKIVSELDIVLAQVLIEAIIMEVSLDRGNTVAASYLQNNPSSPGNYFTGVGGINNGTFLNRNNFLPAAGTNLANIPSGFSYWANFGGDFQATLTAIANDDHITVLSRPRIQTSHGVKASLQVGDTVPEVTGTYFGGIVGGQASSQYQQTFVGIDLEVTPLINPDGLVVMDISQDVEQLGTPTTIDGNPVPTTSKRTAEATVSVRDRDTIILGGMISTSKSSTRAGVPFLKDIPVLGYLFRSTSDDNARKELIVLIRPTVLPTPESAALAATHEINKMPAVKAAEAEQKIDELRRQKAVEKIKIQDDN